MKKFTSKQNTRTKEKEKKILMYNSVNRFFHFALQDHSRVDPELLTFMDVMLDKEENQQNAAKLCEKNSQR
jgi:hypothetical protein